MSGGRVAGIISVVLAVLAGVAGILNYAGHHPRRGLVALIAGAVLLVLGLVLIIVVRGSSRAQPGT